MACPGVLPSGCPFSRKSYASGHESHLMVRAMQEGAKRKGLSRLLRIDRPGCSLAMRELSFEIERSPRARHEGWWRLPRTTASLTTHGHRTRGRKPSSLDSRLLLIRSSRNQLPSGLGRITNYDVPPSILRTQDLFIGRIKASYCVSHLLAQLP